MTTSISAKVRHVITAKQTRDHACHWPGCKRQVRPAMWGCREHWYALPKELRDRIWQAYRPGQENTGRPTAEYIAAARAVRSWIEQQARVDFAQIAQSCLEERDGRFYATEEGKQKLLAWLRSHGLNPDVRIVDGRYELG